MKARYTRRMLLHRAIAAGAVMPMARRIAFAQDTPPLALSLARSLNRIKFSDLSPTAIKHAKMILASTFASAAPG